LGPGLLESVYERCLAHELRKLGLRVASQLPLAVMYDGEVIDGCFRIDLLVEDTVIVEIKAVEGMQPLFTAQLMSYLKLSNKPVGLLINFNTVHLRNGIKRIVNGRVPEEINSSVSSVSSVAIPRV
ncbi:MAG: GxxExxY protein, partial [Terriglobales bacterium]